MAFLPSPTQLVIATHNEGKVREFSALINHGVLKDAGLSCISAGALGLPEPEETEKTFAGNARLKALAAARAAQRPALADDSGLAVEALSGAPGIYSARWAGPDKDFRAAMKKVQDELQAAGSATTGARAAFVAALCLALPDGRYMDSEAQTHGTLCFPPRGEKGFGYDPIFIPAGEMRSFGEMSLAEKEKYSHRAKAFAGLVKKLAAA